MSPRASDVVLHVVAFVLGLPAAFFFAFNAVFADSFGLAERALGVGVVALAYLVLGAALGAASRRAGWRAGLSLAAPAILILLWYTTREPQQALFHVAVLLAAAVPAMLASEVASRWRRGRVRTVARA